MDTRIEDIGPCQKRLHITIPAAELREELEAGFREASRYARIPGFRPGKVPRAMLEKRFGPSVRESVKEQAVEKAYRKALEESRLEPLGDPQVEGLEAKPLDESQDLAFTVTLDIFPEIRLGDLGGITVKRGNTSVSEAEIDQGLDGLARSRARLEPVPDAEVQREDHVRARLEFFQGERSLRVFEKAVLSPIRPLPGADPEEFRAKLLGRRAGEESRVPLTYTSDFEVEAARGQAGEAVVAIEEVLREKIPPVDEELAKAVGVEGGVEGLRRRMEEMLRREKEGQDRSRQEEEITDQLLADHPFELPRSVLERQQEARMTRAKSEMEAQGLPAEEVATRLAGMREEARDGDVRAIKRFFLIREVARRQKIFVTEEELNRAVRILATERHVPYEKYRAELENRGLLAEIRYDLQERKVLDLLRQKAKVVEEEA